MSIKSLQPRFRPLAITLVALLAVAGGSAGHTAAAQARATHSGQAQSYQMRVLKTAYCLRGHTATGTYVHQGAIAVDPRLIPLGSRLYVPGYGAGRAEDTGGAIKGHHIDVWMPSCSVALRSTTYVNITVYR
jgi:3D (Asp-Asp-Asp) domain-containing protein